MIRNFESVGYRASSMRLDTKNYYLPQTRTRGYLLAIASEVALPDVIHRWEKQLKAMERDASASLEAFMLDAHDPRVLAAREDLSYKRRDKEDTPWDKCEARHARVRIEEKCTTAPRHVANLFFVETLSRSLGWARSAP